MYAQNQQFMPDEDLAYTVLADLKRVTREYGTAATESVCPSVRQQFTQLLNTTLAMQGELYTAMSQQNMYSAASPALRQEIDKQMKEYQQTQQKTNQFLQQKKSAQSQPSPQAWGYQPAPQWPSYAPQNMGHAGQQPHSSTGQHTPGQYM
ncbi:spore coat protein [Cohnella thailandensis]|uniref:Spore coat protein n=1 Tax=Cohnella thailandensis TaxID=557557 RepID=A0A841SP36_9BACL|nr:spore coat protein [Cohnella thailandensis]MBB6633714.1 spore coat protein [Cohnella thailandensis]MBP1976502.1 spore coat protein CotF [Cohnella thailandensis]